MFSSMILVVLAALALDPALANLRPSPDSNPCNEGECTPYHRCASGPSIEYSDGQINLDFGEENGQTGDHPCYGSLETCCTQQGPPALTIPTVAVHEKCGVRNSAGIGLSTMRFSGETSDDAQFGEFPWIVAVLRDERALDKKINIYQCSGSLIHPSVVLTAASCVAGKDAQSLSVRAGEWDSQSEDELFPHQLRTVEEFVVHEQFVKSGLLYDVALLFLSQPVDIAENVNTICLPAQDQTFDTQSCVVSGWNRDAFGKEGKYQVILSAVQVPVVPRDVCEAALRGTRLGSRFNLNPSSICAGGESGVNSCRADRGAPLMCPIPNTENQYVQAGIVSWKVGCDRGQTPGVYANVASVRSWIEGKMNEHQFDTSSYSNE